MNDFESIVDNMDNTEAMRVLLHNIKGISPVSTPVMEFVPVEDD